MTSAQLRHTARPLADGSSPRTGIHAKMDALLERKLQLPERVKIEATNDVFALPLEPLRLKKQFSRAKRSRT